MQGLLIDNPVARSVRRALVPKTLRSWVRNRRTIPGRRTIPDARAAAIQSRFSEDRDRLAELFPEHPALDLCYPFIQA